MPVALVNRNIMSLVKMKTYILLTVVFIASFASAWLLPVDAVMKGLVASPALIAMLGVLYQLLTRHLSRYA